MEQAVRFFSIRLQMVERVLLIHCETNAIMWNDADLIPGGRYFLAFSHLGTNVTRENIRQLLENSPELIPLFRRKLYARSDEDEFHIAV